MNMQTSFAADIGDSLQYHEDGVRRSVQTDGISTKRFIAIFASIFALGSLPLLLQQPSGVASAGLSLGFTLPIERWFDLAIFAGLGLYASTQRSQALILVPLSFILLFVVGVAMHLDAQRYALMPMYVFGAVILFAISITAAGERRSLLAMLVAASLGFHFGRHYVDAVPSIASPLYFLIGNILSLSLVFATAISFGLIFRGGDGKAD